VIKFIKGQRWQSDTESDLGMGQVSAVDFRTVTIEYPGAQCTRVYAADNPPITRVHFGEGDVVQSVDNWSMTVTHVKTCDDLFVYCGLDDNKRERELPEMELAHFTQYSSPKNRLILGQVDPTHWFELRLKSQDILYRLSQTAVKGLYGPRIGLIPHQLYIAHTVGQRPAPRVLLADEVGLGKTIEAGLILHQQVLNGQAQRILLLVPETLVHQWLVEMLRRFNLRFSIFDEMRCEAIEESADLDPDGTAVNPFHTEQLVLCGIDFLIQNPHWRDYLLQGQWDLLVVDEAHHLQWDPQLASAEYQLVDQLSQTTPSMLLLTATPEQLGAAGHFARLRLLDPNRFHTLEAFVKEEESYKPVAKAALSVLNGEKIGVTAKKALKRYLGDDYDEATLNQLNEAKKETSKIAAAREAIVHQLIDRHGTGRVLFRNTRTAIAGFPQRQMHEYKLPTVKEYQQCIKLLLSDKELNTVFLKAIRAPLQQLLLSPELIYQTLFELGSTLDTIQSHWTNIDPRLPWLATLLKELKPQKVLVICANRNTVLDLEKTLAKSGHRVSVFHEGMSIVERDRAAAYFADMESGAGTLICSEIGSEGRNFQFAHHLVLFDLPYLPDLLEQRIGRLDRIGQTQTIDIHVPYLSGSAQHTLFRWYNEGINAFNQTCAPAQTIFNQLKSRLHKQLETQRGATSKAMADLLQQTQELHRTTLKQLQQGRDRLLELNSHRKENSAQLIQAIEQWDQDAELPIHLEKICHLFGVEFEDHSDRAYIIKPSDHMLVPSFPELPEEGMTVTFDRDTALVHENMVFLSWEHPFVIAAMDMILSGEFGSTAFSVIKHPQVQAGTLLLECVFIVESVAPAKLQMERFLPPTPIRVLMDEQGQNYSENPAFQQLNVQAMELDKDTIKEVVASRKPLILNLLHSCEEVALTHSSKLLNNVKKNAKNINLTEIERMEALKKVNPSVREEEIELLQLRMQQILSALSTSSTKLSAIRLLVST